MAGSKKPSLFIPLLLLLLVASAVHGTQPAAADAGDTAGGGERVTVTVRSSGHGHGYSSSHSGGHTSGGTPEQGGAGAVVDPRNLNARSHHRSGAASRAGLGCSSLMAWGLVGAILAVVVLP